VPYATQPNAAPYPVTERNVNITDKKLLCRLVLKKGSLLEKLDFLVLFGQSGDWKARIAVNFGSYMPLCLTHLCSRVRTKIDHEGAESRVFMKKLI
jgi:hypothetical protein